MGKGSVRGSVVLFVVGVGALALSFMIPHGGGSGQERYDVVVSVPPLAWPVTELAPGARVKMLVPPGVSPHVWQMSPSDARAVEGAKVVVLVGMGFEPGIERLLAGMDGGDRVVVRLGDLVEGIGAAHDHAHEGGADHAHGATDPHAWLDPEAMQKLVSELVGVLAGAGLGERLVLEVHAADAAAECDAVDAAYRETVVALGSRTIVAGHNAYGYLAERYGLTVAAVIRPVDGVEPSPGDVRAAAEALERGGAGAIFVEPQFSGESARRIAERVGAEVYTLDPLGDGDWPAMMRANLEALKKGLGGDG